MKILRLGATVVILAAGVGGLMALVKSRPQNQRVPPAQRGVLVEVQTVQPASHRLSVVAHGTVTAARELSLAPQLSGAVMEQHPQLIAGGLIKAGELLLRVDETDYQLTAAQRRAQVEQAAQALELEQGRKAVAMREWQLMGTAGADKGSVGRATREPQVKQAEATLAAARSAQRMATVAQGRARVVAPFNALVLQESVEVGQLVGPAAPVVKLVDTDEFFVEVLVPIRDLPLVRLPSAPGEKGARVVVRVPSGAGHVEREGFVVRRLGELDAQSRMARIVVAVADPLGLAQPAEPLLLRAYVEVSIEGPTLDNVIAVPRDAVREGNTVYVIDGENRLQIKAFEELRREGAQVLVQTGLAAGDRVITSRVPGAVAGMVVRLPGEAPPSAPKAPESRP
jgi:RND family efflux transporter MFP subunit